MGRVITEGSRLGFPSSSTDRPAGRLRGAGQHRGGGRAPEPGGGERAPEPGGGGRAPEPGAPGLGLCVSVLARYVCRSPRRRVCAGCERACDRGSVQVDDRCVRACVCAAGVHLCVCERVCALCVSARLGWAVCVRASMRECVYERVCLKV